MNRWCGRDIAEKCNGRCIQIHVKLQGSGLRIVGRLSGAVVAGRKATATAARGPFVPTTFPSRLSPSSQAFVFGGISL